MPTSATGTSANSPSPGRHISGRGSRGFTLIEISVVLLIIGILTGAMTLSIVRRPLEERQHVEAQRLQHLIEFASGQAQLQSRQIGLLVGKAAYRFLYLDDKREWLPYTEGPLRLRKLPAPFTLRLYLGQRAISIGALPGAITSGADTDNAATGRHSSREPLNPQIMFLSSGEATPFQLDVLAPQESLTYRLNTNALGAVTLKQAAAR